MSKALLQDITLTNAKGESVQGETLGQGGKVLALYFAADWCPDCRAFQPTLNNFYTAASDDLDVVFVGSDASAKDQLAHFRTSRAPGGWCPLRVTRVRSSSASLACAPAPSRSVANHPLLSGTSSTETTQRPVSLTGKMVDALLLNTTLVNTKGETIDGGDVESVSNLQLYVLHVLLGLNRRTGAQTAAPSSRSSTTSMLKRTPRRSSLISSSELDMSEEDQQTHFSTKHGDWWMVPRDAEIRNELRRKYGIRNGKDDAEVGVTHRTSGIPALVIVRPDGEVLDFEGVQQIESNGIKALANWQAKAQSKEQ
ncbi:Thioredoxin-like fold [Phytophthora cactorum]|nr:Thioredoxin-like fold [Phytophthora cactorum]